VGTEERRPRGDAREAAVTTEGAFVAAARPRVDPKRPLPSREELSDALGALFAARGRPVDPASLHARDPALIERALPLLEAIYDHVFDCETEFLGEVPDGPALLVSNHNGMTGTPDMFCHMTAFWRRYGTARPAYGLMHDVPFRVPWAGPWMNAAGALAANPANARAALKHGAAVLVFPGGDYDACKPFHARHRIDFGDRRGYARLALAERVPIVPVVSVGGHESLWVACRGTRIARALGLPRRFRSNVFPVGLALPWGLLVGVPLPHLPLPVKVHTRVLRPLVLAPLDPEDPRAVESVHQRVVGTMQAALEEMVREGRHGLWPNERREKLARTLQSLRNSFNRVGGG
jgi:1-acyl-sn-glycerol-3-phosphate acyltransferase